MNPRPNVASASTRLNLYSLRYVEVLFGRSRLELRDLASHSIRFYRPFPLTAKARPFAQKGELPKKRWIDNPVDPLKAIQSRIEERFLKRLILPEHLLGGVRGKSIADNVKLHLQAKCLVTIDIKNFFPSISPQQVLAVFRGTLNCSPEVSYLLTGLTTCRGRLPQGAPTSTLLANLVLGSLDHEIRSVCRLKGVVYSSWVDDLAFSGDSATQVIGPVIAALKEAGFSVSHRKIKVMGPGDRKVLNSLVLGRFITVKRQYRSSIRAGIHNLKCGRVPAPGIGAYVESLYGSINYLRLFEPSKAICFSEELSGVAEELTLKPDVAPAATLLQRQAPTPRKVAKHETHQSREPE